MKKTKHQKFTKENGLESFVPNRAEKRWSLRFHLFFRFQLTYFRQTVHFLKSKLHVDCIFRKDESQKETMSKLKTADANAIRRSIQTDRTLL